MKKFILVTMLLLITMQAQGTFTAQDYIDAKTYLGSGNKLLDPLYLYIVDAQGADTAGKPFFYYIPGTAPATTEGYLYYSASLDALVLRTASAWVTLEAGGDFASLDEGYNGGAAITVDSGAVTLTAGNDDDNVVLALVQSDTGTSVTMTLTNAGSGNTIDIQGTSGNDIEGTGNTWNVTTTGVATFLSLTLGNGGIINNTTDNEIEFIENNEEFSFAFNGNTLTYATDSGIDTIDFGVVDALVGINSIAFDVAVANTITQAGTGAGDDLTIQQTASAIDASLILQSSGNSTTNALSLISSAGSTKIDSADNLDLDAADDLTLDTAGGVITLTSVGGDITINATNSSVIIDGGEAVTDAINIDSVGGLDVDVSLSISLKSTENTTDAIELVATAGGIDITATGASAGEDIDIIATGSSVNITSTENNVGAIVITENGGTSGGINIFADQGTGVSATTEHDASVQLHSDVGGIGLYTTSNQGNDIRIEVNGGSNETIIISSLQGTSVTENSAAITINATAGGINIQSDANLDDALVLRVDGGTAAELTIHNDQGTTTDSIELISDDGGIVLTAGKPVVVTNAFEVAYVLVPNGAAYTVLAANSGHVHLIPDQSATVTLDLPAEVSGLRYRFVHVGGAADAQNWIIDTENNTNYYIGGLVQHDVDDGGDDTAVYYSDGSDDSILTIVTPGTGTDIEIWCNGTQWYVRGTVISATNTGVTFTNL